jgi:hypothetical protein
MTPDVILSSALSLTFSVIILELFVLTNADSHSPAVCTPKSCSQFFFQHSQHAASPDDLGCVNLKSLSLARFVVVLFASGLRMARF